MKFLTTVHIDRFPIQIEHDNSILAIGSCFAENIGSYFLKYKFDSLVNPFGVLYNSASIKNSIQLAIENKSFSEDDLIFDQDEWHSFYHHSDFSSHKLEDVITKINAATKDVNEFLKSVDWIIISLGTSFVYKHKSQDIIVSNCHKIPQKEFKREFLSVDENAKNLNTILDLVHSLNPKVKFILTVSPVRHWKDGAHQNQLSKSSLHMAIDNVIKENKDVFYFPSYEIVIDELRDYRFYAQDLLHPSKEAIEYIWERFSDICLSDNCKPIINEINKIVQASKHRVRNPSSTKNKEFAAANISKIKELQDKHAYLNFDEELNKFYSYLDQ